MLHLRVVGYLPVDFAARLEANEHSVLSGLLIAPDKPNINYEGPYDFGDGPVHRFEIAGFWPTNTLVESQAVVNALASVGTIKDAIAIELNVPEGKDHQSATDLMPG